RLAPSTLASGGAAVAVGLVLRDGALGNLYGGLRSSAVAGAHPAHRAATADVARADALIRFAPQASADDVTKFLESNKATLVDGPMSGGLYRIRIANTSKDELNRIITRMQENRAVVGFVGTAQ